MGQDENTNPFNGNETPVFETPTPTPAPEAPVAPAPAPAPVAEAPAAPAPIPVTKPGQVSESVSQLSSYNRLGMRPSRNLSAREELDRIAPKAPVAPAPAAKEKGPRDPKIKIIIVLVIVTAIALVAMLVISAMSGNGGIFGGKKNSAVSTSGEANLDVIFDDKAYLPYFENGLWGYKNPENGEVVIKAKYTAAERFYGDYAAVSFVDGDTAKSAIIDKEGNVKLEQKNSSAEVKYDDRYDIWIINGDIYSNKLVKLNPEETSGQYIGGGYMKISKSGDSGITLVSESGAEVRKCKDICSIKISDNQKYAIILDGTAASIIRIPSGEESYSIKNIESITEIKDNIFAFYKTNLNHYVDVSNEVKELDNYSQSDNIYDSYISEKCDNGFYHVKKENEEIIGCAINDISVPYGNTYKYSQKKGTKDIIIKQGNEVKVYSLQEKKEKKKLGVIYSYRFINNSGFLMTENENGLTIYNFNNPDYKMQITTQDSIIKSNDMYLVIQSGTSIKTYNAKLKEM